MVYRNTHSTGFLLALSLVGSFIVAMVLYLLLNSPLIAGVSIFAIVSDLLIRLVYKGTLRTVTFKMWHAILRYRGGMSVDGSYDLFATWGTALNWINEDLWCRFSRYQDFESFAFSAWSHVQWPTQRVNPITGRYKIFCEKKTVWLKWPAGPGMTGQRT